MINGEAEQTPKSDLKDMSESGPDKDTGNANVTEFTVSELSGAVKRQIEDSFGHVRVRAELGRVSRPNSGHVYLDLKDDKAVLAGVIWKGVVQKMPIQPEQGLEVICTGRMTTFPGQSKYQLVIDYMEPAGVGALMALLEERKKKLAAEGLFDPENKQPIPFLPEVIGVVTSPTGSVIRDILHRLADRFPRRVLIWPVRVQGESCAEEVARAIAGFNALPIGGNATRPAGGDTAIPRPDLLIVARGGGSLEDLWGFNEEVVARTAAQSDIPLISAIGHETDTTLIDYAADRRAPTPTAAAEMAVPVRHELQATIMDQHRRLLRAQTRMLETRRDRLLGLARGLPRLEDMLALPRQRLDHVTLRLSRSLSFNIQAHRARLSGRVAGLSLRVVQQTVFRGRQGLHDLAQRLQRGQRQVLADVAQNYQAVARQLDLLSYESVLARGFALVLTEDGQPVRQPAQAPIGSLLDIRLAADNRLAARVEAGGKQPATKKAKQTPKQAPKQTKKQTPKQTQKPKRENETKPPRQGKLFE